MTLNNDHGGSDNNKPSSTITRPEIPIDCTMKTATESDFGDPVPFPDVQLPSTGGDPRDTTLSRSLFPPDQSSPLDRLTADDPSTEFSSQLPSAPQPPMAPPTVFPTAVAPPTTTNPNPDDLVVPSGIAGGLVGLLMGGPIFGALTGFGSAYAVRKENAAGDLARSLGEVALSVQATGKEWEEKHHVVRDTARAIEEADSRLAMQARTVIQKGWQSAVELNRKHNLLERGVEGTGQGLEFVAEKIQSMANKDIQDQNAPCYQNVEHHVVRDNASVEEADSGLTTQARTVIQTGWRSAVELNREYNILERGVEGTAQGLEFVAENLRSMASKNNQGQSGPTSYQNVEKFDPPQSN